MKAAAQVPLAERNGRVCVCVKEDEIKANKNHIKEYYSLTAISLGLPVSFWWIPHLVQWMV